MRTIKIALLVLSLLGTVSLDADAQSPVRSRSNLPGVSAQQTGYRYGYNRRRRKPRRPRGPNAGQRGRYMQPRSII